MAVPASSTSLDWQLEKANTLNINRGALDAAIRKLVHSIFWTQTSYFGPQHFSFVKEGTTEKR